MIKNSDFFHLSDVLPTCQNWLFSKNICHVDLKKTKKSIKGDRKKANMKIEMTITTYEKEKKKKIFSISNVYQSNLLHPCNFFQIYHDRITFMFKTRLKYSKIITNHPKSLQFKKMTISTYY